MSAEIEYCIPPSTLRWLTELAEDRAVTVLLRHSVRGPLPDDSAGVDVPLTSTGERLARELGALLGTRLRTLHASPLVRTMQTAEALRTGAGVDLTINADPLLGQPGVYVLETKTAWTNWERFGFEGMIRRLNSGEALPGMAEPDEAARFLVKSMLAHATGPGVHVFVTHDSLVTVTAARFLGVELGRADWPWYLEGAFFWRDDSGAVHAAYRERHATRTAELCSLDQRDAIELARREVAATVGLDCAARFFVAGGAFKALLTGRPPRDLDIWGATPKDRELLVAALRQRGARELPPPPFGEEFEINGRVVDIPHRAEPPTLEGRLARFDLALSAIGVEHSAGTWRAVVHHLARECVERREVLLLKPLVNWKYALSTLDRMRRYARELGFTVPAAEEEFVWACYDAQDAETRAGMVERYCRTRETSADILARAGAGGRGRPQPACPDKAEALTEPASPPPCPGTPRDARAGR